MDPTRATPVTRATSYWRGTGIFLLFALLLAVIWFFNRQAAATIEEVVAVVRYATKAQLERTQAASLPQQAIDAALPAVADQLAAAKPAAVEQPEQVVPGSPTAAKLAVPPPVSTPVMDVTPAVPAPPDPAHKDADKPPVPAHGPPRN